MSTNQFELLNLKEIFLNGHRAFIVPEYQRGYSWEERQREDLVKDIENLLEQDYKHYTGTIVASKTEETDNTVELYDIVDGQQRLTSLVILLATMLQQQKLSETSAGELQKIFIASGMDEGNTVRKFSLNSLLDTYFYRYVIQEGMGKETILTKSHRNIANAFEEFNKWLQTTPYNHDKLYSAITEKLGFMLYAPNNSAEIGIMFEVINNRGKPLSELEKIKNYLIYFAEKNGIKDLRTTVDISWGEILKNLNESGMTSNDDENSFLRNCWIVFADTNKSRSYYVYDNLKERFPPKDKDKWDKLKEFVLFLENASNTYRYLLSQNEISEISGDEKKWLQYISLHASNASIMPLIIALYEKVSSSEERTKLLELLEKLNFRYYGCGVANRSDTGQGDLFWWAHRFYNKYAEIIEDENETYVIDIDWLETTLRNFVQKHAHDHLFIEYLTLDKDEEYDYYGWNNLRFFLANYEEGLRKNKKRSIDIQKMLAPQRKEAMNDYFHKEHIWAKKEKTIIEEEDEINKRRLGNFVLLEPSINISVSKDPIEKKVKDYYELTKKDVPSTYMLYELQELYKKSKKELEGEWKRKTWKYWYVLNQDFLDRREEKLLTFAVERWRVQGIDKNVKNVVVNSNTTNNKNYELHDKKVK